MKDRFLAVRISNHFCVLKANKVQVSKQHVAFLEDEESLLSG